MLSLHSKRLLPAISTSWLSATALKTVSISALTYKGADYIDSPESN
jgi:hypothetical protein